MRKLLSISLLFLATFAFAVPARRVKKTINLADGTQRVVTLSGDEFNHYYQAEDGKLYIGDDDCGYKLCSAELIKQRGAQRAQQRNLQRKAKLQTGLAATTDASNANRVKVLGKKKGLVILVNFSDRKMSISQEEYNNFFNQEGYSNYGMGGSVHDYFRDCSYNQFDLTFDVIGPVTVSKQMSYYGKNDSQGYDQHPAEMIIEAVKLADELGVDFSDYDWSNDGMVDQVYVIYAGYGENNDAPSTTIWPHEYELSSAKYSGDGTGAVKIDGVTIDTYACSNELYGTSGQKIDGIGTACHEFSHCMGIPDMYDTVGSNFGMNVWDLMDYGCYHNDGYTPCGYTSYERWVSGWLTPVELTEGCEISDMPSLASSPTAYIIYNKNYKNEYYLLENRQQDGWHKYDYGHGMLVLHVDYSASAWYENTVNNTASHQRMTIIPADNKLSDNSYTDLAGDPWPGTKKKTALTDTSTPAATLYNVNSNGKKFMNAPIENITENVNKKTISFSFNGGVSIDIPSDVDVKEASETGFTAVWSSVPMATGYEIELRENVVDTTLVNEESLLLAEDFASFAKGTSDGTSDISGSLDTYTSTPGWSGNKIYTTAGSEAKIGSGSTAGHITTPSITSSTGTVFVSVTLRPYGTDSPSFYLGIGEDLQSDDVNVAEESSYCFSISECYEPIQLTFAASKATKCRFYISEVRVYNEVPAELQQQVASRSMVPRRISNVSTFTTTDCFYVFTDLNPASTYSFRVRTIVDEKYSSWSSLTDVTLSNPTNLHSHPVEIIPNGQVYNMHGQKVAEENLPNGIYIRDGRKIVIK